jgi:glycosyltransferase involved in cell wall biosynthesis
MKVLAFPHHLEIGGVQTNAVDLATAVRDRFGHETVFCATPGPAAKLIADRGFRLIELAWPKIQPSPTLARQVYGIARRERPDLIHAYDNQQIFDAFFGVHLIGRVPMLATNMSMAVQRFLPRSIPITYGTAELADEAAQVQRAPVWLLEPPVNTDENGPDIVDATPFRRQWHLDEGSITIVVVSRLVSWLKAEGLLRAVDAVAELAADRAVRLVIVGGGGLFDQLSERARSVNESGGRTIVTLTGPLIDPRPAYAAADIVIGMGGSILRGMAFAKPAIVLGERGFSEVFEPDSAGLFFHKGLYGVGDGRPSDLRRQLAGLVDDPDRRALLAAFAQSTIIERYGLAASAAALDGMYRQTLSRKQSVARQVGDAAATAVRRAATQLPSQVKQRIKTRLREP